MSVDTRPFTGHYQGYRSGAFVREQDKVLQQVRTLFDGSAVTRFHTMPLVTPNTVGQHSHGVAMLCWLLFPEASRNLLLAALVHDLAEQYVGDVPSPAKKAMGAGNTLSELEAKLLDTVGMNFELTSLEEWILKVADCYDGMLYIIRERVQGNRSKMLTAAYCKYSEYLHAHREGYFKYPYGPNVTELLTRVTMVGVAVQHLWEEANNE